MQDAFFVLRAATATARVGEPWHQVALKDVAPDDAIMRTIGIAIVGRMTDGIFPLGEHLLNELLVFLVVGQ